MLKTSKLSRDGAVWGLLMVAPTIIGLVVLNMWPFIQTIYMSFSKSLPFGEFEFEGLENYVEMFQNTEFWKATGNTILFCILTVPVGIFLALLVAVLLNSKIRGRTTFRAFDLRSGADLVQHRLRRRAAAGGSAEREPHAV